MLYIWIQPQISDILDFVLVHSVIICWKTRRNFLRRGSLSALLKALILIWKYTSAMRNFGVCCCLEFFIIGGQALIAAWFSLSQMVVTGIVLYYDDFKQSFISCCKPLFCHYQPCCTFFQTVICQQLCFSGFCCCQDLECTA